MYITYQIAWRETLYCTCGKNRFSVEITMGELHVYFPCERIWGANAPEWAAGLWQTAVDQTRNWCAAQNIPFEVAENTWVSFDKPADEGQPSGVTAPP